MRKTILLAFLAAASLFAQSPAFPGRVVSDNDLMVAANNVNSTLAIAITNSSTSFTVTSGVGYAPNMLVTIDSEILVVCGVVGNTLQIGKSSCPNTDGRGFNSTIAGAHNIGANVAVNMDAWHRNSDRVELEAIETALGANLSNIGNLNTPQAAHAALIGPVSGSPAPPTYRAIQNGDLPSPLTVSTTGSSANFTGTLAGDITGTQSATVISLIQGHLVASSAYIDTTNASNISTGILGSGRLPTPTTGSLGGVRAVGCGGGAISAINSDGSETCSAIGSGNVTGPSSSTPFNVPIWDATVNRQLDNGFAASPVGPAAGIIPITNGSGVLASQFFPSPLSTMVSKTLLGTGTDLPTFSGSYASGNCVVTLADGTLDASGAPIGGATTECAFAPTGGGTANHIPYWLGGNQNLSAGLAYGATSTVNGLVQGNGSGKLDSSWFPAAIPSTAAGITGLTAFTGTQILVGSGVFTNGDCLAVGAGPTVVDNGTPCGSGGGGGTVLSVALTAPGIFSVAGSPVTTTGTLALTLATQSANLVWAGPGTGSPAAPTFRALVAADLPSGYPYSSLSGAPTLPISIANGGTGQTTQAAGFNALSPMATLGDTIYGGASGAATVLAGNITGTQKFLCQTGTGSVSAAPAWCNSPGGATAVTNDTNVTGSISGATLTLGWTGTLAAGRLNANVVQAITNDSNLTGSISAQNLTLGWTGTLPVARGGTGSATAGPGFANLSPLTTLGDLIVEDATPTPVRLAGNTTTTRKFLRQAGNGAISALPAWDTLVSGDIPNNAASTTGNALTATGFAATPTKCSAGNYPLGVDASGNAQNCTAATGAGTVTSVGLVAPSIFNVTGSPVAASGNLTFALVAQSPNLVFAGPASGGSANPTFRALTSADLPSGFGSFSGLASGTNTSAAMLVGSGSSLAPTVNGTVTSNGLQNSLIVNLKDPAATGGCALKVDGATDESSAFQTCVNANPNATFVIPSGATLVAGNVTISAANVRIVGAGSGGGIFGGSVNTGMSRILYPSGASSSGFILKWLNSTNHKIQGGGVERVRLDGNATAQYGLIATDAYGFVVQDVTIVNYGSGSLVGKGLWLNSDGVLQPNCGGGIVGQFVDNFFTYPANIASVGMALGTVENPSDNLKEVCSVKVGKAHLNYGGLVGSHGLWMNQNDSNSFDDLNVNAVIGGNSVSGVSCTSGTCTVTLSSSHAIPSGQSDGIFLVGSSNDLLKGNFVATYASASTFTIPVPGIPNGSYSASSAAGASVYMNHTNANTFGHLQTNNGVVSQNNIAATIDNYIARWDVEDQGGSQFFGNPAYYNKPVGFAATTQSGELLNLWNITTTGSAGSSYGAYSIRANCDSTISDCGLHLTNNGASGKDWVFFSSGGGSGLGNGTLTIATADDTTPRMQIIPSTFGTIKMFGPVLHSPVATSGLPTCNGVTEGSVQAVTDASVNTWGSTFTGSSSNHVLAYCDGSNWTVMGK